MANITNSTSNTLITGTSGNDTIPNDYETENVTILSGNGNDWIENKSDYLIDN